jgi:GDSL-like Lipase/Acylhydrolase/FG-GAP-like repeat
MQVPNAISRGVSGNTLYVFWGGANDITNQQNPGDVVPAATAAAQVIEGQIRSLINAGAKNIAWLNMPPFNRIPTGATNGALSNAYGQGSTAFNSQQAASIANLRNQYASRGVLITSVDMYSLFSSVLNSPAAYGFSNVTVSAAGLGVNPDTYFFWKDGHFTTSANITIANEVFRNVQRFFAGAGASGTSVINAGPGNGRLDFDGDYTSDYTVWRPANGTWYSTLSSNPTPRAQTFGLATDVPVPGDYDGDGLTDYAVWRPSNGTWYIIPSSNPGAPYSQQWGGFGDTAAPADYDGDGRTDVAVYRPATGFWFVLPSGAPGTSIVRQWGLAGDIAVAADYDGDGKADPAVWRPSDGTWYIQPSTNPTGVLYQQWGASGDIPMPGDYDGDRRIDYAVWRPSTGTWFTMSSRSGSTSVANWGAPGDIPVYGDFDGDSRTDFAIFRPGDQAWYVNPSSNLSASWSRLWGQIGDLTF